MTITGHEYHDDIQGILQTALTGVTQYTFRQLRTTGLIYPHVAQGDIFSMTFQMSHRKQLGSNLDGVHIHYVPVASSNGEIKFNWAWGWYNTFGDDTIPATLPNTGSTTITLATTDQHKLKINQLMTVLAPPASEAYSSILMVKVERVVPDGTNWGANNEIAIVYMDGHMQA
jgi:hypothetical protein